MSDLSAADLAAIRAALARHESPCGAAMSHGAFCGADRGHAGGHVVAREVDAWPFVERLLAHVDRPAARVRELEAPGKCQSLHKLRARLNNILRTLDIMGQPASAEGAIAATVADAAMLDEDRERFKAVAAQWRTAIHAAERERNTLAAAMARLSAILDGMGEGATLAETKDALYKAAWDAWREGSRGQSSPNEWWRPFADAYWQACWQERDELRATLAKLTGGAP